MPPLSPQASFNVTATKEDKLFLLFLRHGFQGTPEQKQQLLQIWAEEKREFPLHEISVIQRLKTLGAISETGEYTGRTNSRPEAQIIAQRLELALLFGWRSLPGGMRIEDLLYKHDLTGQRPDLSEEFILINRLKHYLNHGKLPDRNGTVDDLKNERWDPWAQNIRTGGRGTNCYCSMTDLDIKYGLKLGLLTEQTILELSLKNLETHGVFLSESSKHVGTYLCETGNAIAVALALKNRGLPRKITLAELIKEYICKQAEEHQRKTGKRANRSSGPLPDHPNITWETVDNGFLAAQTSLYKVLIEAPTTNNEINENTVWEEIIFFMLENENGYKWPTQHSGKEWKQWDEALERGYYRLPGKSSLPKLIRQKVIEHAHMHAERTGEILSRNSSIVTGLERHGITGAMLDDAFLAGWGRAKSSLNTVLEGVDFSEALEIYHSRIQDEAERLAHFEKPESYPPQNSTSEERIFPAIPSPNAEEPEKIAAFKPFDPA